MRQEYSRQNGRYWIRYDFRHVDHAWAPSKFADSDGLGWNLRQRQNPLVVLDQGVKNNQDLYLKPWYFRGPNGTSMIEAKNNISGLQALSRMRNGCRVHRIHSIE